MEIDSLLRQTFHVRYPLLFGLTLACIGPLAMMPPLRRLLSNVLLLHNWKQVAFLTAICYSMATLLTLHFWIIKNNGPCRFRDWSTPAKTADTFLAWFNEPIHPYWSWSWAGTTCWLLAAMSLPLCSIWYSRRTANEDRYFPSNVSRWGAAVGVLAGLAMFAVILVCATFVSSKYLHVKTRADRMSPLDGLVKSNDDAGLYSLGDWLGRRLSSSGTTCSNGFARTEQTANGPVGYLAPGHLEAAILTLFLLIYYVALYFFTDGAAVAVDRRWLPTSFFAVLLLMTFSAVFALAGFWLDLYRLPPLLFVPFILLIAYCRDDHFFRVHFGELQRSANAGGMHHRAAPELLVREVKPDASGRRTLVVVTAPGGGIHAAAWTAQVLTGLHARYPQSFADSIGLISAVSGGSVGAMHYLNSYEALSQLPRDEDSNTGPALEDLSRQVVSGAAASSLEAVGWGSAFPDLADLLTPYWNFFEDRGEIVERLWNDLLLGELPAGEHRCQRKLRRSRPTLRSWGQRVAAGTLPAFAFNATEAESGRRVVFSPVVLPGRPELTRHHLSPRQFCELYPMDADIDITTCARLSATFPYVFPAAVSRHIHCGKLTEPGRLGRVVDGGYVDNEGIITAVDWLSHLLKEQRPAFDRIVLIRIRHQPMPSQAGDDRHAPTRGNGFVAAVASPAQAVISVRTSSQTERGQIEAEILEQVRQVEIQLFDSLTDDAKRQVREANRQYQSPTIKAAERAPGEEATAGSFLIPIFIDYDPPSSHRVSAPLSWKLSPREFSTYEVAWRRLTDPEQTSPPIALLDKIFAAPRGLKDETPT